MRWNASIASLILTLALLAPETPQAFAGAPTDQLKSRVDLVLKNLGDTEARREQPRERRAALRKIADEIFDWEETAKRSMGMHWQQRTPAEREEFVRLFADLLDRSYVSKLELYDGEKIGFTGDTIDGDQAIVRTRILTKQGSEIPVNYKMLRRDDRWKVYDVEIQGVSLISNYRTQFNTLLRRTSYGELVKTLRAKTGEPETEIGMASPRTR